MPHYLKVKYRFQLSELQSLYSLFCKQNLSPVIIDMYMYCIRLSFNQMLLSFADNIIYEHN